MNNKKAILFCILGFACNNVAISQSINLVPNSSFEEYSQCPTNGGQIYYALSWTAATGSSATGSSDFLHCCSVEPDILLNIYNNQYPRTGCGEASIILLGPFLENYREYLEIELKDSLRVNKKYCGKFYVSLNNYANYAIENIGMYFSPTEVIQTSLGGPLLCVPQIQNTNGIIKDTLNWVKISGTFIASGGEKYLVIGNFDSTIYTNYIYVGGTSNPRYFIDDISVCNCEDFNISLGADTTLCIGQQLLLQPKLPKETDSVVYTWQDGSHSKTFPVNQAGTYSVSAYIEDYNITVSASITINYEDCTTPTLWIPNSFTPNGDGINDVFAIKTIEAFSQFNMMIYNRWGQLIFESDDANKSWDGTFKDKAVPMGIYTYHIEATSKESKEKKSYNGKVMVIK